jgi:hypothetical protein
MKLTNGVKIEHLPDGVLVEGHKLDFDGLCELMLQALITSPLTTDDPRVRMVDQIRQAIIVSAPDGRRFLKLDLLQPLPCSKGHEALSGKHEAGRY